jgi:cation:H+ antiporter
VNPLPPLLETLGLASPWAYVPLFLGASLLLIWRLEAIARSGLQGTAVGAVLMPFCSGLGNLLFVWSAHAHGLPGAEVATNALVNNVTNLTLLLGLPAVLFGLSLAPAKAARGGRRRTTEAKTEGRLNRLSLGFTVVAGLFFVGAAWTLGRDGVLDAVDGGVLVGGFAFWITVQAVDAMKYAVQRRRTPGLAVVGDLALVLLAAGVLFTSIDWLAGWVVRAGAGLPAGTIGWISGALMVVPNGLLAFYYAARGRGEMVYASQVGDGHICIPLCLGLAALLAPVSVPAAYLPGLGLLAAALALHFAAVLLGGLSRPAGWFLLAAYAAFLAVGLPA